MISLYKGDCLVEMEKIADGSVDMILADLPYGTTACKWDNVIPFEPLWKHYWRVLKPNGAVVLFGSEPFSSYLRMSQIKYYKYDWIWDKLKAGNFAQSRFQPMKYHELISVFYRNKPIFYPQKTSVHKTNTRHLGKKSINRQDRAEAGGIKSMIQYSNVYEPDKILPRSIVVFSKDNYKSNCHHPTQKPVALLEYLIKTYTNENETVLDNTMGSGSTGVACVNTNRNFIGIEMDEKYFDIAEKRIKEALPC